MISDKAHIDPSAKLGENVTIHPFAYIDKDVEIGDNTVVMPFASIIRGSRIGKNCKIYQGAIALTRRISAGKAVSPIATSATTW